MESFDLIAQKCHEDRIAEEKKNRSNLKFQAKKEFNMFNIWCRIFNKKVSEQSLKEYIKTEEKNIPFVILKTMMEQYFGYVYKFDYTKQCWLIKKPKLK